MVNYLLEYQHRNRTDTSDGSSTVVGPVLHFYFDGNEQNYLTANNLFRSLTKQLVAYLPNEPFELEASIKALYGPDSAPPSHEEMVTIVLLPLLKLFPNPFMLVDGLNESGARDSTAILEGFCSILAEPECSARVFISGRDELNVTERIPGAVRVWIDSSKNEADIERVTQYQIDRCMRTCRTISDNPETVKLIETTLIAKAKGM